MKALKKIFLWLGSTLILLTAALFVLPFLFRDQIENRLKEEINNNIFATVNWDGISLSFFRNFPNLSFAIHGLRVSGTGDFKGDTLAGIPTLRLVINLKSLVSGNQLEIRSILLDRPRIHAHVLEDGRANWDITVPSDTAAADTTPSAFNIGLKKLEVIEGDIIYDDESLGFYLRMEKTGHRMKGDFTQDLFTMETLTEAENVKMSYGGVSYLAGVKANIRADLDMDMQKYRYTFRNNEIVLNGLPVRVNGFIEMPAEDIVMDLGIGSPSSDFKSILSLMPAVFTKDFEDVKTSGKMSFGGHVKGTYSETSMPAYTFRVGISDAMFQYPGLPVPVNNIQLDLKAANPDGNADHTSLDINRFHCELGREPFDAVLHMKHPLSDPEIDARLKGKIDLGMVKKIVPLEDVTRLAGVFQADIALKGRMSQIEKQQYEQFDAKGQASLSRFMYASKDLPQGVAIQEMLLLFTPREVLLNKLMARLGKSDLNAAGSIHNLPGYLLKDEVLRATANLSSNVMDLNEWMAEEPVAAQPAAQEQGTPAVTAPIEVPGNIELTASAAIGKLLYDNLEFQNVKGALTVRDKVLTLHQVAMEALGGKIVMSGTYDTRDIRKPGFGFSTELKGLDIKKSYESFVTVQKFAPIAKFASGTFSTDLQIGGTLGQDMMPDFTTLGGKGLMLVTELLLKNFSGLEKMADALKIQELKDLKLFEMKPSFEIRNGRLTVKPFDVKWGRTGNWKMNVSGSNGLDQTLDYLMKLEVPRSELSAQANAALNTLLAKANMKAPDLVRVNIRLGGTFTNPTVTTDFKESAASLEEAVKEEIKEIVKEQKEEIKEDIKAKASEEAAKLIREAEAKAAVIRSEAQKMADKVKSEGYANATRLETEAKNPVAKAAAKVAANKLRKETDEKAKKITDEAGRKASALVDEAKQKAAALMK